jgi:hypothetical protein
LERRSPKTADQSPPIWGKLYFGFFGRKRAIVAVLDIPLLSTTYVLLLFLHLDQIPMHIIPE